MGPPLLDLCLADRRTPVSLFRGVLTRICQSIDQYDTCQGDMLHDWLSPTKAFSSALSRGRGDLAIGVIMEFPDITDTFDGGVLVNVVDCIKMYPMAPECTHALELAGNLLTFNFSPLTHHQGKTTALGLSLKLMGTPHLREAVQMLLDRFKDLVEKLQGGSFDTLFLQSNSSIPSNERKTICQWIVKQCDLYHSVNYPEIIAGKLKEAYEKDDLTYLESIISIRPSSEPLDIMAYLLSCKSPLPTVFFIQTLVKHGAKLQYGEGVALIVSQLNKSLACSKIKLAQCILSIPTSDGTHLRHVLGAPGSDTSFNGFNLGPVFPLSTYQNQKPLSEEVEIVICLIKDLRSAIDFCARDEEGLSLLHKAAALGLTSLVQALCEVGAGDLWLGEAMITLDSAGRTPLHWAVSSSHPWDQTEPLVRCLAEANPEVLAPSWVPSLSSPGYKHLRACVPKKKQELSELIEKVRVLNSILTHSPKKQLHQELNLSKKKAVKADAKGGKKAPQADGKASTSDAPGSDPGASEVSASDELPLPTTLAPAVVQVDPLDILDSLKANEPLEDNAAQREEE